MSVPPRFVGVWQRTGLGVEDGPVLPDGEVFWLQAEECFADLRTGGGEQRGFAGRASWDPPAMTWRAEIEVPPATGAELPDVGDLDDEGDLLIERGTWLRNGRTERYVEHWQRVGARGPVVALRRATERFLAVADVAVLVTPSGGCRWERSGEAWVVRATVGDGGQAAPPAVGEDGWVTWQ